jgi:hypothetical protein
MCIRRNWWFFRAFLFIAKKGWFSTRGYKTNGYHPYEYLAKSGYNHLLIKKFLSVFPWHCWLRSENQTIYIWKFLLLFLPFRQWKSREMGFLDLWRLILLLSIGKKIIWIFCQNSTNILWVEYMSQILDLNLKLQKRVIEKILNIA